jgi:hypothetical protein
MKDKAYFRPLLTQSLKMNFKIFASLIGLSMVLSSCGIFKKGPFVATKNIAVLEISAPTNLVNNNSLQGRLVGEAMTDTLSIYPPNEVRDRVFKLNPVLSQKFMDEDQVLNDPSYAKLKEALADRAELIQTLQNLSTLGADHQPADGYAYFPPSSKGERAELMTYLPSNVDAAMFIDADLSMEDNASVSIGGVSSAGLGRQKVNCTLNILVFDKDGSLIVSKVIAVISDDKIGRNGEKPTVDDVTLQAIDMAFADMEKWLAKKISKL